MRNALFVLALSASVAFGDDWWRSESPGVSNAGGRVVVDNGIVNWILPHAGIVTPQGFVMQYDYGMVFQRMVLGAVFPGLSTNGIVTYEMINRFVNDGAGLPWQSLKAAQMLIPFSPGTREVPEGEASVHPEPWLPALVPLVRASTFIATNPGVSGVYSQRVHAVYPRATWMHGEEEDGLYAMPHDRKMSGKVYYGLQLRYKLIATP